jgi:2-polyprenyl-3-methyl-5-hydroxy-6-metoxy-1,4-benzoquinol methylase
MLKNDQSFWDPGCVNPVKLSWGRSDGDFTKLLEHSILRWGVIAERLIKDGVGTPSGHVIEFGAGMGLSDDLLDNSVTKITMLDHSPGYLAARPKPLSSRCEYKKWDPSVLHDGHAYDWLLIMAVFYHVDTATAVALLIELSKVIRQGGKILVYGWDDQSKDNLRADAYNRLFGNYPHYCVNAAAVIEAVTPELIVKAEYHKAWPMMIFEKK